MRSEGDGYHSALEQGTVEGIAVWEHVYATMYGVYSVDDLRRWLKATPSARSLVSAEQWTHLLDADSHGRVLREAHANAVAGLLLAGDGSTRADRAPVELHLLVVSHYGAKSPPAQAP